MISFRRHLISASAIVSVLSIVSGAALAGALPSGGHYVSGKGEIGNAGQSLTVKQSSTTGIIDWNKFSIDSKNAVTFDNGSGATLNRVTGGNLSTIAGSLHATGSLYLMNSSGVIVSGSGRVVTGGSFVATTGNISNTAFGDGDTRFGIGRGSVINRGSITAGGTATLAGRNVSDSGTIHAAQVNLDARRELTVAGSVTAATANGAGGSVTARAHTIVIGTNGAIDASASSAGEKGGTIKLVARGTTTVAGTLKADGGKNGAGGFIETSGEHVHVANSAKISTLAANGNAGTWLIDPNDFTIAASGGDITGATLSTELANGTVVIRSSKGAQSGSGDIFVNDTVSWTRKTTLTLDAFHSIEINDAISGTGGGKNGSRLVLKIDDGGTGGEVTQTAPIAIYGLLLLGAGDFELTDASNKIGTFAANVGILDLNSSITLVPGDVNKVQGVTTSGALTITTGGNFYGIDGPITVGTTANITAAGFIWAGGVMSPMIAQTADFVGGGEVQVDVDAQTVTGSSNGTTSSSDGQTQINGNYQDLGSFNTHGGELFAFSNGNMTVTGTIDASSMTLGGGDCTGSDCAPTDLIIDGRLMASQIDLQAIAKISESKSAAIQGTTLTVESTSGSIELTSAHNKVTEFEQTQEANSGNHAVEFTDDHALKTIGAIGTGTGQVVLKTVGANHNLEISWQSTVGDGGVVTLITSGEATESDNGEIDASTLNVTANTGIALTSEENIITTVGTDTTSSGPNNITL